MQEIPKESELRQTTVMFADISGFTAISEKMHPEEVTSIMNQCFSMMGSIIKNNEGNIDKFIGDCVMAVFGVPSAIENAPLKAVNTAIEIRNRLYQFNKDMNLAMPLDIHIGINTGTVLAGMVGSADKQEYTVMGDTVNLASRLADASETSQIMVGPSTYRATRDVFEYRKMKPITLKGKENPVYVFELLSRKEKIHRKRISSDRMIQSEMVGRDNELNKLELQIHNVIEGKGGIDSVIGEAGIGKSRLIAELKNKKIMEKVTLIEGRALSIGRNLSFHPIIDILKSWSKIGEADTEAESMSKLESAIKNIHPEETDEIFPFVATLMGMKLTGKHAERVKGIEGEALEKLILKNMKDLIIKASETSPLVFIIEDFHWADTSSLELIESLFRLAETQRVLFVNVFRPGYEETGGRTLKKLREDYPKYHTELYLQPLDTNGSDLLIDNLLKIRGLPNDLRDNIKGRSEGNPFFIEEVVRSFIDEGVVELKGGNFIITDKVNSVVIPDTIQELLMSRIDRLDERTKSLIKMASVIGRTFFYKILAEVAKTIKEIDEKLEYLKEVQLIIEGKRMEEIEYLFKHALAQDATYESILLQKRKELHLKVAYAIEYVFSKRLYEFYGMLAYHYSRGDNLDKAEEYLIKAGEEALKSSGSSEALHYYKEALNIYQMKYGKTADPEKVAMLEKNIALAHFNRGQYVEAVEYFDRALDYYWGGLPKHPISAAFTFLSGFLHFLVSLYLPFLKFNKIPTEKDNEIISFFYKKLQALVIINPKKFFIDSFNFYRRVTNFNLKKFELGIGIWVGASALFSFTGISFRLSRKILDLVKDMADKDDAKPFIIYDLLETAHYSLEGNWKIIKEFDEDLVNRNISIGEIYFASQNLYWHCCTKIYQGYLDTSKLLVNKLYEIGKVYENEFSILLKYLLNTSILIEYRKLPDAMIEVEEGIDFVQKKDAGIFLLDMFSCKAWIHNLMGDIEEAEKSLERANRISSEVNAVPLNVSNLYRSQFEYFLNRFEELIKTGNKSGSFELRKKAIISGKMLLKSLQKVALYRTDSYKLMGVYYWMIKKQEKALKWWNRAIKEGERLGTRLELSRTYFEVGKRLLEDNSRYKELNGIKAQGYLEKAQVLFEEMDLQWDLDELSRVTKG